MDRSAAQLRREASLAPTPATAAEGYECSDEMSEDFNQDVRDVLDTVAVMLAAKNAAYGDSALNPVRVFSKADPVEQIRVRIDDKLSRLARGDEAGEDVVLDMLGYLVLLRIAQKRGVK